MNRLVQILVLSLALMLVLNACSSPASQPLSLSEQDNGKQVMLKSGDLMLVVLPGNPTTGYSWEVEQIDLDVLKPVGEPTFESDSQLLGADGKVTMRFEAVKSGKTTLQLVYHRPWEKGMPPLETFEVSVEVGS